jgi:hypothetical protein
MLASATRRPWRRIDPGAIPQSPTVPILDLCEGILLHWRVQCQCPMGYPSGRYGKGQSVTICVRRKSAEARRVLTLSAGAPTEVVSLRR